LPESSAEMDLSKEANAPAGVLVHLVNGFPTKINKIATEGSERIKKAAFLQRRKCGNEYVPDGSVEP
jgi:hypothetical protein